MTKIKGVYDGRHVRLLEPVHLIVKEGLLLAKEVSWPEEAPFEPVPIEGPPLSQTIIEERR
jgi:hypothetical protein